VQDSLFVDIRKCPRHIPAPQCLYAGEAEFVQGRRRFRYPFELWETCDGEQYAFLMDVQVNRSLANGAAQKLAAEVQTQWPRVNIFVEVWPDQSPEGWTYCYSDGSGGRDRLDKEALERAGLFLKEI